MSPLDMRFSQRKMRHTFADGRPLTDSAEAVNVVRNEDAGEGDPQWRLEAPFPAIEVVRWRCKIRDERTGRPKVDEATGLEMYDPEDHWFTLDNRRLYCLQVAAASVYPETCSVEVLQIPPGPPERMRELRKFRTLDSGRSIMIGSRVDGVPFKQWSWEAKVGIDIVVGGDAADPAAQARLKGRRNKSGEFRKAGAPGEGDCQGQAGAPQRSPKGALDDGRAEMSKKISWILRHGAKSMGLEMDEEGWIKISHLMELDLFARLPEDAVLEVVNQSNEQKLRYELKEGPGGKLLRAAGQKTAQNQNQSGDGHGEGKGKSRGKQKGGDGKGRGRGDGKGKGGEYSGDQGWQQGGWQQGGWQQSSWQLSGADAKGGGDAKGSGKGKEGKGADKKGGKAQQGVAKAKAKGKAKAKAESKAEQKGEPKDVALSRQDEIDNEVALAAEAAHASHVAGSAYAGASAAVPPAARAALAAPAAGLPSSDIADNAGASLLAAMKVGGFGSQAGSLPPPFAPGGGPPGAGPPGAGIAHRTATGGYPYPPPGSLPPGSLPPGSLPPGSLPPGSLPQFGSVGGPPPYGGMAYGEAQAHYMQAMQQMQQVQQMQAMRQLQAMQAMAWAQAAGGGAYMGPGAGMGMPPPGPGGMPAGYHGGAGVPDSAAAGTRRNRKAKQPKPQ